ncbi:MAG: type II toxin-antitoxin system Phd/YefM family antitoxin [Chloroflexi bacterium]|nr:type II toxin-antitoxin system Phd/YefM family antitoxin [Chloroflexota bacterium]
MSTKKLTIQQAQTNLSKHIDDLKPGDRIILCCGNEPVAEMLPFADRSNETRPVGLGRGQAEVPDSFFDPLPGDILHSFRNTSD